MCRGASVQDGGGACSRGVALLPCCVRCGGVPFRPCAVVPSSFRSRVVGAFSWRVAWRSGRRRGVAFASDDCKRGGVCRPRSAALRVAVFVSRRSCPQKGERRRVSSKGRAVCRVSNQPTTSAPSVWRVPSVCAVHGAPCGACGGVGVRVALCRVNLIKELFGAPFVESDHGAKRAYQTTAK